MNYPAAGFVIGLAVLQSITAYSDGAGCLEPPSLAGGRFEFGAGVTPGADGRYPTYSLVSIACYTGYKLKGEGSVIYCKDDGEWSQPAKCQASNCDEPQAPWNGEVKLRNGHAITICKPGFSRVGPRRKTCSRTQRGLLWTPARATRCISVAGNSCRNPGVLHGANWTLALSDRRSRRDDETFSPNTQINITCWPGFASAGAPAQITCGMSGEWSPVVPTCQEVLCPSLLDSEANIDHLRSTMENKTYMLGEAVDYHCDQGYRILGKTWRECSGPNSDFPNRTWTELDPVCTEILCPDPGNIQYGGRYLVSMHIGGNVTFRCRSGYSLRGSAVRHCLPNGKWSGTLTTCDHESFYCPNPGIPIGGRMVNAYDVRFRKGETVAYECNGNRVLIGSAERECNRSRSWNGEAPTCQGPYDFDDPVEIAKRIGYKAEGYAIDTHTPPTNNTTSSKGRSIDLGYTGGMDIYFAFDASGSIPAGYFEDGLKLAKALVRKIGVADGPRRAHYGVVVYASTPETVLLVSNPQPSVDDVNERINSVSALRTDDIGKGTATGLALRHIHTDMIPASHRPDVKRILFLFTDGKTNMAGNEALPKREAKILRDDYKVQIHCIGVGTEIDRDELQQIATKPLSEHLFFIERYGDLNLLAQEITKQKLDYSPCGYNGAPNQARGGRISGGDVAEDGKWPWQVALFCDQGIANCDDCVPKFFCGGSLIARNWVLSAAHCFFEGCAWSDIRVYTGILDKSDDVLQEFNPALVYSLDGEDDLILHGEYNDNNLDNDIALLRLNRNATLNPRIRPICMPQPDMQDGTIYSTTGEQPFVAGWGATVPYEVDGCRNGDTLYRGSSPVLKELSIPLKTAEECRDSLDDHFICETAHSYKEDKAFCAGYTEGNLDACKGDSGGPVMRKLFLPDGTERWVQIGIVSWGEGCAQDGRYGIYTRLSNYKDWIKERIGTAYLIR